MTIESVLESHVTCASSLERSIVQIGLESTVVPENETHIDTVVGRRSDSLKSLEPNSGLKRRLKRSQFYKHSVFFKTTSVFKKKRVFFLSRAHQVRARHPGARRASVFQPIEARRCRSS